MPSARRRTRRSSQRSIEATVPLPSLPACFFLLRVGTSSSYYAGQRVWDAWTSPRRKAIIFLLYIILYLVQIQVESC